MARPAPPLQPLVDIDADAAERFDSDEILEHSNIQRANNDTVPWFVDESDLTRKSSGKQDEIFHNFTCGASVEHDAVGLTTRTSPILSETRPSSAARECCGIDTGSD